MCSIVWDVHQFIRHWLIPLDPMVLRDKTFRGQLSIRRHNMLKGTLGKMIQFVCSRNFEGYVTILHNFLLQDKLTKMPPPPQHTPKKCIFFYIGFLFSLEISTTAKHFILQGLVKEYFDIGRFKAIF